MAARPKVVYLIRESGDGSETFWSRQGVAFVNRDKSLNLRLDMFPELSFNIRDPKPRDDDNAGEEEEPDDNP